MINENNYITAGKGYRNDPVSDLKTLVEFRNSTPGFEEWCNPALDNLLNVITSSMTEETRKGKRGPEKVKFIAIEKSNTDALSIVLDAVPKVLHLISGKNGHSLYAIGNVIQEAYSTTFTTGYKMSSRPSDFGRQELIDAGRQIGGYDDNSVSGKLGKAGRDILDVRSAYNGLMPTLIHLHSQAVEVILEKALGKKVDQLEKAPAIDPKEGEVRTAGTPEVTREAKRQ